MNGKSEVFYFPSPSGRLFGILQPPSGPARDEGIVICYPAPQEIMRSYHAHVQLSRMLASLGYTVLRFDYSGSGDSDGETRDISLAAWERDTLAAIAWLKTNRQLNRVHMIGTRLGATIALRASAHGGIAQLVLWDPIIDGISYIRQMKASHRAMLERNSAEAPFPSPVYSEEQCWGFAWPKAFQEELAAISPALLKTYVKRIHLIQSQNEYEAWIQSFASTPTQIEQHNVGEPIPWDDDRTMRLRSFPTVTLKTVTRILGGS